MWPIWMSDPGVQRDQAMEFSSEWANQFLGEQALVA